MLTQDMFAQSLQEAIENKKSFLCVGFDPDIETFPTFIISEAESKTALNEEFIYRVLVSFYELALEAVGSYAVIIKPNIAFFERYGLAGMRAFVSVCSLIKERKLLCLVDAKRGDIGNTAQHYARAFFGFSHASRFTTSLVSADALTVNPFLGFDTLEPFLQVAEELGKGLFVLVKTSNPGSGDIQDRKDATSGKSISELIAEWVTKHEKRLRGDNIFSGLGAVVGATHPEQAVHLRKIMPKCFFLIPGVGAQGGTFESAQAGFAEDKDAPQIPFRNPGGGLIQVSRGIFSGIEAQNRQDYIHAIGGRVLALTNR